MTLAKISRRYPIGSNIKYLGDNFTVLYEDLYDFDELKEFPVRHGAYGKIVWYLTDGDDLHDISETFQCLKNGEKDCNKNYTGLLVEWGTMFNALPIASELYFGKDTFTRELA